LANAGIAIPLAAAYGHTDDLMVAYLVLAATASYLTGSATRTGLLLGLAVGIKLWVLLAVGLLLLHTWRLAIRAALTFGALTAALFLPFMCSGQFGMFRFIWQVEDPAPLRFLLSEGTPFPWSLRLMQAIACLLLGACAALWSRGAARAVWVVPGAVIGCRILLDPRSCPYYWAALAAVVLVGAWGNATWTMVERLLATWLTVVGVFLISGPEGLEGRLIACVLCAAAVAAPFVSFASRDHTPEPVLPERATARRESAVLEPV
jgi:hypothetical protein